MSVFLNELVNRKSADTNTDQQPIQLDNNSQQFSPHYEESITGITQLLHNNNAATSSAASTSDVDSDNRVRKRRLEEMEDGELDPTDQHDDIIAELAKQCRDTQVGKPVSNVLRSMVEEYFQRDFKAKSIDNSTSNLKRVLKKFEDIQIPSNLVDCLRPVETNEPVAKAAFKDAKIKKLHHEVIKSESCLTKIAANQVKLIDGLLDLKKACKGQKDSSIITMQDGLIRQAALGLEFMGLEKFNLIQIRKEALMGAINPNYRNLAENSQSSSDKLFGDDLHRRVQDIDTSHKLAKKFDTSPAGWSGDRRPKSFLGQRPYEQNRFRRRGNQSYHTVRRPLSPHRPAYRPAYKKQPTQNTR